MNNKLEVKSLYVMVLPIIMITMYNVVSIIYYVSPYGDNTIEPFSIFFIIFSQFAVLVHTIILMRSVTRLILENDIFTIKQLFRKPTEIELKNISSIFALGDIKHGRHIHLIRSKDKNFNTSLIMETNIDIFIEELKIRVGKAKQQ